ncbi:MAG: carboxypeptidase-like regulatory domain-containing protein [Acidobacteriota bacterium]|nr:carboxypeptidase-like regulatory domain-containing protein [Acidobacteriota bacterium]
MAPLAAIDIRNEGTGFTRHSETDESGFFRFTVLPLGSYTVSVKANGFAPARSTGIALSAGSTVTLDLPLQLGAQPVDFIVTGEAPVIEPGRTDLGSTLVQPNVSGIRPPNLAYPARSMQMDLQTT